MTTDNGTVVSTIPVPILTVAQDDYYKWVLNKRTYSAANAFSIISTDQTSLPDSPNANFQLGMDVLQDPATMLAPGTSSVLYSSNCTSIVAAAASVDSHLHFALANLSTVAKADYQNSSNGELGLIRGDFNSPFLQMYDGLVTPAAAQFAHFLLWDWYRRHYHNVNAVPNEKFYALGWFNGYAMYSVGKDQRNTDGSVNASGGASFFGLASVSGSLQAQFQRFGSTSVTNYAIAARTFDPTQQSPPKLRFDQLDSPDSIVTWAQTSAGTTLNQPAGFSNVLSQASPNATTHEQIFSALPGGLCDHSLWFLNPASKAGVGAFAVVGERVIPKTDTQPLPSCALSISFVPESTVWSEPAGSVVNVQYALDTKIADKKMEISTTPIAFSTSNFPALQASVIGPAGFKVTPVNPGSTVEWNLNEILVDDPHDPIDRTKPITVINQPSLSHCTVGGGQIGIPGNGVTFANSLVAIKIQQFFSSTPDPSNPDDTFCTVSVTLGFKTGKGRNVSAALPSNTLLLYPAQPVPHTFHLTLTR